MADPLALPTQPARPYDESRAASPAHQSHLDAITALTSHNDRDEKGPQR
ncbi:hypothetical protein AB0M57_10755 [Streptomyces sp. NPDC051597]